MSYCVVLVYEYMPPFFSSSFFIYDVVKDRRGEGCIFIEY